VNRDASSIAILEPRNNVGYRREDVPRARDGQIRDLVLELADNASFEQVSGLVPRDADRVLTAFAERAASIAVRGKDERELRAGPRSHCRCPTTKETYYLPWPSSTGRRR
jgi:hypothetical protein